ncbi:MAG: M23 family metallopeptidase [Alphaproteobacteria bacterium]|nr:M23 family metallopeptidase [Alphaproteobacteria bacterium]
MKFYKILYFSGVAGLLVLGIWAAFWLATPEWSAPRLSAKPAPAPPYMEAAWRQAPPTHRRIITTHLKSRDTLAALLTRHDIAAREAQEALNALRPVYNPRRLPAQKAVRLYYEWQADADETTKVFAGFDFLANARLRIIVRRTPNTDQFSNQASNQSSNHFTATQHERVLHERQFFIDALITSSFYETARKRGMSSGAVVALLRLFSFTTDFQRDIRNGDRLEVLYTRRFDDTDNFAEEGDIIFAALTNRGNRRAFWRTEHNDGTFGFYDDDGASVQRLLMSTPIDGARLSSNFGLRRDPIKGYTRKHLGLDFAAPIGTPIYAAGDGVITEIARKGSYGNYISIRHNNNFTTAYAHLNKFAKGLRKGSRVKQTQTIAYVGRTGRVTGPHLHYEVLRNGKAVNPRTITAPANIKLSKINRQRLNEARARITQQINQLSAAGNATPSLQ